MEDDEMPEDGDPVAVLLQDPYLRAVLDLLLVTRIPGDRFGRATMTGLAWYGAMDGRKDPEVLAELMRWLRLEHEEALREWGELGVRGGRDLRDRETQQRAVELGEEVLGRVADETIRKVIGHLEARAGKSMLGLEKDRLRQALKSLARQTEIGVMERVLAALKSSKDLRDAADAAAVMEYGLAEARWARAEARLIELEGEREAYGTHRGRWVRSQADVGRYLGRDQTAICRALRKKSKQGTLIKLATDFAEKRVKGFPFAHEDADPVGPGRASVGATGTVAKASRGMEVVR